MRVLHLRPGATALAAAAALLAGAGGLAWAAWVEPYHRLEVDRLRLPVLAGDGEGFRIAHLSDLHVRAGDAAGQRALERLAAQVAGARPQLVAISGDLWDDAADPAGVAANIEAAADFAARLAGLAPVIAIQGHSDHLGHGVARLAEAGVRWLGNESLRIEAAAGPFLLVGLSQQAGFDELVRELRDDRPRFTALPREDGGTAWGVDFEGRTRNVYAHFDPSPVARERPDAPWRPPDDEPRLPGPADPRLAAADGPLAWSGYDASVETWISDADTGAGMVVHSLRPLGEDRMIRLRRVGPAPGENGSFVLVAHGTAFTSGQPDTGVVPEPGRWYRMRVATRSTAEAVGVAAKVWPAGSLEPAEWQAWAEDRSPRRTTAGTVGLWAWGGGTVLYRHFTVTAADGEPLHHAPLDPAEDGTAPEGWHTGTRDSRLALALTRAPRVPPETPRVVLTHSPDPAPEASWRGIEAVLAGHTHGGQIALPLQGALTTRSGLGRHYDTGVFQLAAFNRRGWTTLYVNGGFGTSLLPLRFAAPPRLGIVDLTPRSD